MVARPHNQNEESDAFNTGDVRILTHEEAWDFFNDQALRTLGISGEEFLRRWDSGLYSPVPDTPEGWPVARLAMLIPFVPAKKS